MGENIRASLNTLPDANHVVLTGNVHTKNAKGMRGRPDYEPMAFTLPCLAPLSLDIDFASGKAWQCKARRTCGEVSFGALPALLPKSVGLSFSKLLLLAGFDGAYFVGALSASPPAAAALGVAAP